MIISRIIFRPLNICNAKLQLCFISSKDKNKKMKNKIGLIIFISCIAILFYCPNIVHAYNIGADVKICLADPMNIFDPDWPDLYFTMTGNYSVGNYFYSYDLVVDKWIPIPLPGHWERVYDLPGTFTPQCGGAYPCPPGTYMHTIPPGILDVDGSTYIVWASAYGQFYDWTPWAHGTFTLNQIPGECGTTVIDGESTCPYVDVAGFSDYPNLCKQYSKFSPPSPTNPTPPGEEPDGSTWTWDCSGSVGLPPTNCQELVRTVTWPSCGSIMDATICAPSGTITSASPGLCDVSATPPIVKNIGTAENPNWTWTCEAECSATNVPSRDRTCSRGFTPMIVPTCGEASGKNFCNKNSKPDVSDTSKLCTAGSTYVLNSLEEKYNEWIWKCRGLCPSTTVECTAGNSKSCGWVETN